MFNFKCLIEGNRSRTLKSGIPASFKPHLRFADAAFRLVPILQRKNPYGIHSHAGAWEREKTFYLLPSKP